MLYDSRLPAVTSELSTMRIECLFAVPGSLLKVGEKLLDFSVDLSPAFSQDCPPISYYRLVMRERLWLRQWRAAAGDVCAAAQAFAIFSNEPDEAMAGASARLVRTATAGIVLHPAMWSAAA